MVKNKLKKSKGFTLIEMLIVVAIIAILVAVAIPAVSSNIEKAKLATDDANFRIAKELATIMDMDGTYSDGSPIWYTHYHYLREKDAKIETWNGQDEYRAKADGTDHKKGDKIAVVFNTTAPVRVFWTS